MIAEGFLIVQLLDKLSLRSTPPTVGPPSFKPKPITYDPDYDYRLKKPKVVPQITTITQPIIIDPTKIDYGQLDWKPDYKKGRF
jgi:hypothetical protein